MKKFLTAFILGVLASPVIIPFCQGFKEGFIEEWRKCFPKK